ncbi:Outer membrane protein B precursor [Poriferisphaera corsica]|uniref:Outer membrane protein B n=1 Tax=Poriferisphaera corsica TaxID=2528020 RepID=A0A517YZ07_9BACT|nr:autotransporter outer membrane beta-barrel domain-containing protein [Poriferisphaera corsica]QDU35458.1 Outer membrane protein B precursor [Poriferisphaera corsica]
MNNICRYSTATLLSAFTVMSTGLGLCQSINAAPYNAEIKQHIIEDSTTNALACGSFDSDGVNATFTNESFMYAKNTGRGDAYGIQSLGIVNANAILGEIYTESGTSETQYPPSYGSYSYYDSMGIYCSKDVSIAGDVSAKITAIIKGVNSHQNNKIRAAGIFSNGDIVMGDITQDATIVVSADVEYGVGNGIYAKDTMIIGDVAGQIYVKTGHHGRGLSASDNLILGDISGSIIVDDSGIGATGVSSGEVLTVGNITGTIATRSSGSAHGLSSYKAQSIGDISGIIESVSGAGYAARGIYTSNSDLQIGKDNGSDDTVGIRGTIKAISGDLGTPIGDNPSRAYGLHSNGNLTVDGDITGTISAYAAGQPKEDSGIVLPPWTGGGVIIIGGGGTVVYNGTGNSISIGSIGVDGSIMTIDGNASIGLSEYTLTFSAAEETPPVTQVTATLTTAEPVAISAAIYSSKDDGTINLNNITEDATLIAIAEGLNSEAYGILLQSENDNDDSGSVTVGNIDGQIVVGANRKAYGILSEDHLIIGNVSGVISVQANGYSNSGNSLELPGATENVFGAAAGIVSSGDFSIGEISGAIRVHGKDAAIGIASYGTLDTVVSGTIAATTTDGNFNYAINSHTGNDRLTLKDGAVVIGDIDLGSQDVGEADILTLEGYGTYNDTLHNIEHIKVNSAVSLIVGFDDLDAVQKQAAIISSIHETNTWKLSKKAAVDQLDVYTGYLKVDGGVEISGALNLASNAGMIFELTDDATVTAQSINLADGSRLITQQGEAILEQKIYTILDAENVITDNGAIIAIKDSALIDYEIYDASPSDKKQIIATPTSLDSVTSSSNDGIATSLQAALNNASVGQEIKDYVAHLQTLSNAEEIDKVVRKLSPQASIGVADATSNVSTGVTNQLTSRTSSASRSSSLAQSGLSNEYPILLAGPALRDKDGYQAWASTFGSLSKQDDDGLINGYKSKALGTLVGLDRQGENVLVGFALGYAYADIDTNNSNSSTELDALTAGFYAAYQSSAIKYEAGSIYTLGMSDFEREVPLNQTAEADDVLSHTFTNYIGASYEMRLQDDRISLSPNAQFSYTYFTQESYSESGVGSLGLDVDSFNNDIITATVGIKSQYRHSDQLTLNSSLLYKYDLVNDAPTVESSFQSVGSTPFKTTGLETDKNAIELGAGLDYQISDRFKVSCDYSYEHRSSLKTQNLTLGLNLLF